MSTGKTLLSSIFFIEFFLGRKTLYRLHPIPSFRSRDSGRFLRSDPFSHPSGSSALLAAIPLLPFL
jgi:hypothetical protein